MNAHRTSSKILLSSVLLVVGCVGDTNSGSRVDGGDNGDNSPAVVYATGPLPDLVETTTGDPPATTTLGGTFTASDTVTNSGSASATASYTKYYLTANGTTPQYLLGNRSVGALAIGASDSGSTTATVPGGVPAGSYRVLACADAGSGTAGRISQVTESNEINNCTASTGSTTVTGADLTESNVSVSPTSINPSTGTLTVSDQVNNIGNAAAGASVTRWWLSTDNVKDPSDAYIRNCVNGNPIPGRNVGTISAGASSAGSSTTTPLCVRDATGLHPPASGTYYVIACADTTAAVIEQNELNNCTASSNTLTVNGGPDLVETTVTDPPTTGTVGTSFPLTDTVQNVGGDPAPSSYTKFYLSPNGTSLTVYLNTRSVTALTPGQTDTATTTMTVRAGTAPGTYKVIACADSGPGTAARTSQIAETNENNNCRTSAGSITIAAPDLIITTVSDPPPTGSIGTTFAITDTTTNQGNASTGTTFYNKYYLSPNGTSPLYQVAPGALANTLAAGASEQVTATGKVSTATPPGTYWLLDCADAGPGTAGRTSQIVESNENNNCTKSATQIVVQ